jgi:hypothetical protein
MTASYWYRYVCGGGHGSRGIAAGVRVVSEAAVVAGGVRMVVALRVPKREFEGIAAAFRFAVAAASGSGVEKEDVVIEDVADKPGDFRGGGTPASP